MGEPLVLHRSDFGVSRLIVDDEGVTFAGMVRKRRIAFADVHLYRLTQTSKSNAAHTLVQGNMLVPRSFTVCSIEVAGPTGDLDIGLRFNHTEKAVARILARVHERLTAAARAELAKTGVARFGKLALARTGILWRDGLTIGPDAVEAIEVFDAWTTQFRVMKSGQTYPHMSTSLDKIPNLLSALVIARDLGYHVRGLDLLKPMTAELADWVP